MSDEATYAAERLERIAERTLQAHRLDGCTLDVSRSPLSITERVFCERLHRCVELLIFSTSFVHSCSLFLQKCVVAGGEDASRHCI